MPDLFLSPWWPTLAIVSMATLARAMRGSWLSPAAFIGLIWTCYVGACLLLTDFEVFSGGIWFVALFVLSVQSGTILAEGIGRKAAHAGEGCTLDRSMFSAWADRSFQFTALFTGVALAGSFYLLSYSLEKYSLEVSIPDLLSLGQLWSVDRYAGQLEPWSIRLTIMWVYPAGLLGGISFATNCSYMRKVVAILPLIPALMIGTVFAVRAGFLFTVGLWLAGFLAVRYTEGGGTFGLFQRKFVLAMLGLLAGAFAVFIGIDTLRIFHGSDDAQLRIDFPRIAKYLFGSVAAFAAWFHTSSVQDPTWGAYTFSGIFDLLGIKHRQVGLYVEMHTLAGGEDTNIYTLFRGLIQDFTVAGACMFGVLMGTVSGTVTRRTSPESLLVLAAYYSLVLFSPLTSLFTYNGLLLAFAVAALVLGRPAVQRHHLPPSMLAG